MIDEQPIPQSPTTAVDKQQGGFGRFKTSEELVKAYESLEKEFTKRSQRLKELEKQQEVSPIDWEKSVDELITAYPKAQQHLVAIGEEIASSEGLINHPDCLKIAYLNVLEKSYRSEKDYAMDVDFLTKYAVDNKDVKDKIIADYVSSLNTPTVRTTGKGGEVPIAQPLRPKTVEDAGNMALKILKNATK